MIGQLLTGRYLFLKQLGAGGFSETYLARDKYLPHHPLCVVKCLKPSPGSTIPLETARQLFETEARVLDQLGQNHAQIPTLFAYCHEQDQVYLVQEYIEGENLEDWVAKGRRLTMEEAIELLFDVLPILDYIHSHHVIHCDIKPSNLIQCRQDGRMVLIDFGAACILSETGMGGNDPSLAIGTPGYMPDEQETGTSGFSSDLYALGISVIHLLTGVHPRQLQLDPISGELNWPVHLPKQPRGHSIDPKLVAILNRMVQTHARDRYQRASDVIAVLFPLIGVRSLQRRAMPAWRRSLRQMLKPAVAAVLLAGMVGGWYYLDGGKQVGATLSRLGMLSQSNVQLTLLRNLPIQFAIDRMLISPNNRVLVTAGSDHILRLWSLPEGALLKSLSGHTDTVNALDMSRDGSLLASGSKDGTVRIWDADSGLLRQVFQGHQAAVTAVAISPDAHTVVSGGKDGTLRLWDLQTGTQLRQLALADAEVTAVAYGATPDSLISASSDRQIQIWDLQTGKLHRTFTGHTAPIVSLQVVNDHTLCSFGKDRMLWWDLKQEELTWAFSEDISKPMTAFLNDQHIVTVDNNGNMQIWTRKAGQLMTRGSGKSGRNLGVALSPNHRYLVSWSPDRLQVWQVNASAMQ